MKTTIEKARYEGYVWKSDEKVPVVYRGDADVELVLDDCENPFIVEGCLWDNTGRESIYIRYVDGRYIVSRTIVTDEDLQSERCVEKTFVAHRIDGVKSLRYLQYWEPKADEMCEGMQVLCPQKMIFIGFDKKEEKEQ